ncbi:Uncharacterized protein Adt_11919 [Abeliophyllum distichum]|uniref:Uncharacterized protein n=1 Tax=Abeliophyllum distichum TaxID=126358 RepID=A0ABD1UQP7_9LAMI
MENPLTAVTDGYSGYRTEVGLQIDAFCCGGAGIANTSGHCPSTDFLLFHPPSSRLLQVLLGKFLQLCPFVASILNWWLILKHDMIKGSFVKALAATKEFEDLLQLEDKQRDSEFQEAKRRHSQKSRSLKMDIRINYSILSLFTRPYSVLIPSFCWLKSS